MEDLWELYLKHNSCLTIVASPSLYVRDVGSTNESLPLLSLHPTTNLPSTMPLPMPLLSVKRGGHAFQQQWPPPQPKMMTGIKVTMAIDDDNDNN